MSPSRHDWRNADTCDCGEPGCRSYLSRFMPPTEEKKPMTEKPTPQLWERRITWRELPAMPTMHVLNGDAPSRREYTIGGPVRLSLSDQAAGIFEYSKHLTEGTCVRIVGLTPISTMFVAKELIGLEGEDRREAAKRLCKSLCDEVRFAQDGFQYANGGVVFAGDTGFRRVPAQSADKLPPEPLPGTDLFTAVKEALAKGFGLMEKHNDQIHLGGYYSLENMARAAMDAGNMVRRARVAAAEEADDELVKAGIDMCALNGSLPLGIAELAKERDRIKGSFESLTTEWEQRGAANERLKQVNDRNVAIGERIRKTISERGGITDDSYTLEFLIELLADSHESRGQACTSLVEKTAELTAKLEKAEAELKDREGYGPVTAARAALTKAGIDCSFAGVVSGIETLAAQAKETQAELDANRDEIFNVLVSLGLTRTSRTGIKELAGFAGAKKAQLERAKQGRDEAASLVRTKEAQVGTLESQLRALTAVNTQLWRLVGADELGLRTYGVSSDDVKAILRGHGDPRGDRFTWRTITTALNEKLEESDSPYRVVEAKDADLLEGMRWFLDMIPAPQTNEEKKA